MIEIKIEGLEALQRAFKELPVDMHATALRPAVSASAGVVQKQAKMFAGKMRDTGTLQRAIYRTRSRSGSSAVQETAIVGIRFGKKYRRRGQDAWYWRFLEFGTVKMGARPFLRPAFESTKQQQLDVMKQKLRVGIDRAILKMKAKGLK